MSTCEVVAERIALGEPLGEHTEHAATCERCRELVAVAGKLGATHHAVDPGMGFAARITVGAQHRLVVRRRRRIATTVGVTSMAAALMVFVVTRPTERDKPLPAVAITAPDHVKAEGVTLDESELRGLLQLANTEMSARLSADWRHTTQPLRPYKNLLKGIK